MSLFLVEITAWDPAVGDTRVLRFSTGRGFTTRPTDTPSNAHYSPRVSQPVNISRSMFSPGATMGRSTVGFGDLVLLNGDGELDYMLSLGLDGRRVVVLRSAAADPRYPADFRTMLSATMEQAEFAGNSVTIKVRDYQFVLSASLQRSRYAGDNALPDGLEGVDTDLKGKVKPVCLGSVLNVDPPCVNTARLVYQVNDGAVASVDGVYDRGAALARGADYGGRADMEATAPAAGEYRAWPAGGYFRLGASPAGLVTADVSQGAGPEQRTAGQLFQAVFARAAAEDATLTVGASLLSSSGLTLVTDAGLEIVTSSSVDVPVLDAAVPAELGFWSKDEVSVASVLDAVAETVGAWWGADHAGAFRMSLFSAPSYSSPAALSVVRADLLRPLERLSTSDPGSGLPAYRQVVQWGRNHSPQPTDIASSVTDARRAEIAVEWREAVAEDLAVLDAHPLSPVVVRQSLFRHAADAEAEAVRRLALYRSRRDRFELVLPLSDETDQVDFGHVVRVNHDRYGLNVQGNDLGMPFAVIGADVDARAERVTFNVWGSATGSENFVTTGGVYLVGSDGAYLTAELL